jgi:drug/metabolite transporter (DMT)-like permease
VAFKSGAAEESLLSGKPNLNLSNALSSIKVFPSLANLKYAFVLNLFIFSCELLWYISLRETDVGVNTAIYNSLPAFVLICSAIFLKEPINLRKVISLLCFCSLSLGGFCDLRHTGNRRDFFDLQSELFK